MPRRLLWCGVILVGLCYLAATAGLPRVEASPDPSPSASQRAYLPIVSYQSAPTPEVPGVHLGYGANVAERSHSAYLVDMGFDWAKGFVDPADRENPYGPWQNVANQLDEFLIDYGTGPRVHHVLLRVRSAGYDGPPLEDLPDFRQHCTDLATFVEANYKGSGALQTIAYEIWNEPNLRSEWDWRTPSPSEYVALLAAGHAGIKSVDPEAIVVSAGLATGGDVDDLVFLDLMYGVGGQQYFDALGSHPYGGSGHPSEKDGPVYFRRAEEQRAVMEQHGDLETPIWATEFSWIVERPGDCSDGHSWAEVTEAHQSQYLVDAYRYAHEEWSWMGPMFLVLDFGTVSWYPRCEPLRWYSIFYRPYDQWTVQPIARPAVNALVVMEKPSAWD
jgi:hypothetical protein